DLPGGRVAQAEDGRVAGVDGRRPGVRVLAVLAGKGADGQRFVGCPALQPFQDAQAGGAGGTVDKNCVRHGATSPCWAAGARPGQSCCGSGPSPASSDSPPSASARRAATRARAASIWAWTLARLGPP